MLWDPLLDAVEEPSLDVESPVDPGEPVVSEEDLTDVSLVSDVSLVADVPLVAEPPPGLVAVLVTELSVVDEPPPGLDVDETMLVEELAELTLVEVLAAVIEPEEVVTSVVVAVPVDAPDDECRLVAAIEDVVELFV